MTLGIITASVWLFPYLERFKLDRRFALELSQIVPAAARLYVYADHMNDFNYYMQRATIAVLDSPDEVARLRLRPEKSYLLVKERDLRRLSAIPPESIIASRRRNGTTWYLIAFDSQTK